MLIKRIKTYIKLMLPYITPVLFFMIIFLIIYKQSEIQIRKRTVEQTLISLQTAVDYIDSNFLNAYSLLDSAAQHSDIKNLVGVADNFQIKDIAKLIRAQKAFYLMARNNEIVGNHALFFDVDKAIIITPSRILYDIEKLFEMNVISIGGNDYKSFLDIVRRTREGELLNGFSASTMIKTIDYGTYEAIPFIKKLPSSNKNCPLYGITYLNTQKLVDLILPEHSKYLSYSISDCVGSLLYMYSTNTLK